MSGKNVLKARKQTSPISTFTNVVGSYRFDENTGSTVTDSSGNGRTATIQGNPAWTTGLIQYTDDYCLDLDGTGDYLSIVDASAWSFVSGGVDTAFSIEGVVVIDTLANGALFSKWDATTGAELREYAVFLNNDGTITFNCYDESANAYIGRTTSSVISTGLKYHIVCTYSGSGASSGCKIYVNSVQMDNANSASGVYVAMEDLATTPLIGAFTSTAAVAPINGKIDQVTVWNTELSSSTVTANFLQFYKPQYENILSNYAGYQVICEQEIGSAISQYYFPVPLDGDNDGGYEIDIFLNNTDVASYVYVRPLFNGAVATGNRSYIYYPTAGPTSGAYNAGNVLIFGVQGSGSAGNEGAMNYKMLFSKSSSTTGWQRFTINTSSHSNDATGRTENARTAIYLTAPTATTNITSAGFQTEIIAGAAISRGIGTGSKIRLKKLKNFI